MAGASGKILEGVFAIEKPPLLSSAQVLRDLQSHFATSKTFAPLLADTRAREAEQRQHQPRRKRPRDTDHVFKMGHGGTLDPMATGVLIVGIGRGTKHLSEFLGCTKTYETVVLFGKSTDTYDVAGKVVAEAPYEQVTRETVTEKLSQFRGDIQQVPPIYSALKINGMKAYEYARSGKELPKELERRPMTVTECEMVEWFEGGKHEYRWPAEEASEEEKGVAQSLMKTADSTGNPDDLAATAADSMNDQGALEPQTNSPESLSYDFKIPSKAALHTHHLPPTSTSPTPAPAASITLTVSSGFYVRSFAHDLGLACGSLAIMASLVRSRQADFSTDPQAVASRSHNEVGDSALLQALPYSDLSLGESVWGPKIQAMLERWNETHPPSQIEDRTDNRDRRDQWSDHRSTNREGRNGNDWKSRESSSRSYTRKYDRSVGKKRRRNSSSPDV